MHVFIEIPSGSQPISHLLSSRANEIFWKFTPMLNLRKIYNPRYFPQTFASISWTLYTTADQW